MARPGQAPGEFGAEGPGVAQVSPEGSVPPTRTESGHSLSIVDEAGPGNQGGTPRAAVQTQQRRQPGTRRCVALSC